MALLGIDVGTTHCKAGLFDLQGAALALASRPVVTERDAHGCACIDPARLWDTVRSATAEAAAQATGQPVESIGVSSMAESGLLVDRQSGRARSVILPWHDSRAAVQAERFALLESYRSLFHRSGLAPSSKYGLAKILWLREHDRLAVEESVWLSVADYVVFKLTGRMVTDPTLAARTYAYSLPNRAWDAAWLDRFALGPEIFPEVLPSGAIAAPLCGRAASDLGASAGIPVAVAGHDHVCALLGVGITDRGWALDSMGTAESLLGIIGGARRVDVEADSGLAIVPHVLPNGHCWLGGTPSSGGSIEWLRGVMGERTLGYAQLESMAGDAGVHPTGILYFPYLAGSGAPWPDGSMQAAFLGLRAHHRRGHVVRATLEGAAYELEAIRRAAVDLTGAALDDITVVGGGARNRTWLQIKADVSGATHHVPNMTEATVLGAALAAGLGTGALGLGDVTEVGVRLTECGDTFVPNAMRHDAFQRIFEDQYVPARDELQRLQDSRRASSERPAQKVAM